MVIKVTFCEVNNYYHQLQEGCVKTHITPTMALRDMASQRVAEQLQDEGVSRAVKRPLMVSPSDENAP